MFDAWSWRRFEYTVGIGASLSALAVYVLTLCPTTNFIDSGELATVASTLSIAHPTGYPLFTLLAWMFAHVPLGLRTIVQLNLMAAVFCSLGLFFFFRFLVFFLSKFSSAGSATSSVDRSAVTERAIVQVFVPALLGTVILAFSETFWSQAVAIEVYSVHVFFLALLPLLFTKAISANSTGTGTEEAARRQNRYWRGFAFALGLSFANHMTTIVLAPAFLYLYFATQGFTSPAWKRIWRLVIPFMLGLSVYLYLPLRAGSLPPLNWGDPQSAEAFFRHVFAKQYTVWIFSSGETASRQIQYFLNTLMPEFAYFPVALAVIGVWSLLTKKRNKALVFTLLLFLGCVLFAINYDIHDIDSYFLLAYFTIAIWCAQGISAVLMSIKSRRLIAVGVAAGLIGCSMLVISNYRSVDESKTFLVEDYTKDMFRSVGQNGIVLTYEWDYFVSAAYYFQLVEHVRPDVVIIDKELLRRTWYFKQLQHRYPWLIAQSRAEIDAYLHELNKFERNLPYDPGTIEARYNGLIHSFIEKNYSTRPIYATPELEPQYTSGYIRIPSGLALRLSTDSTFRELPFPGFSPRLPRKSNTYIEGIRSLYAQAYLSQAIYLDIHGKRGAAMPFLDSALEMKPDFREAAFFRSRIGGTP